MPVHDYSKGAKYVVSGHARRATGMHPAYLAG
jgi:hypothetical protein